MSEQMLREGRLWLCKTGGSFTQNIQVAVDYFQLKYGDQFKEARLNPLDRERLGVLLDQKPEPVAGLPIGFDPIVPKGHVYLVFEGGKG